MAFCVSLNRIVLVALFMLELPGLHAQFYALAGSATPQRNENFSVALIQVSEDGSVSKKASLFSTRFNSGLAQIDLSHEARMAVLRPHGEGPGQFVVLDFDAAAVVKTCDRPALPLPVVYERLADLPGKGLVLVQEMFGEGQEKLAGLSLDKAVPCENSLIHMIPTDILGLRVFGRSGVSDTGNSDDIDVQVDANGKVGLHLLGVTFPFQIPAEMLNGMRAPMAQILVANSRLVALGLFEKAGSHRILVYCIRNRTWHRLPIPTERVLTARYQSTPIPWLTGFGDYLALTEARAKDAQYTESAGGGAWRSTRTETGPSIAQRFREDEDMVFPGRLHLYDVEHNRSFTITTNQGDSEILLVDGEMVYYRVSNSIFRSSIGETELGPPRLLARAEILGDVHWVFVRHP